MSSNRFPVANPRWAVAERIAEAVLHRYASHVHAIGVHGSLAHGDDDDTSDVDLVVVRGDRGGGPPPGRRRVAGVLVAMGVISVDDYLSMATTLGASWPLTADRFLTTKALYDPMGWHGRLRDTHLGCLAEATVADFAVPARQAWCEAASARLQAVRLAQWHDTDGALLALGEARLATAVVQGLLTRTYFRGSADAVSRTGLGGVGLVDLGDTLSAQAAVLATHGHPVDGEVDDLLGGAVVNRPR